MGNTILTNAMAVPAVAELETNLDIISRCNVQYNRELVAGNGDSYSVILPGFGSTVTTGSDLTGANLDYNSQQVTVTLVQYRKGVEVKAIEEALKLSSFENQIAKPYAYDFGSQMQRKVSDAMAKAATHSVVVASFDKAVNGFPDLIDAISYTNSSRISGEVCGSLSHELHALIRKSGINQFNPSAQIGSMFTKSMIGEFNGVEFSANADIDSLTAGDHTDTGATFAGSGVTVNGALSVDGVSQITLAGMGNAKTVAAGEIFRVATIKNVDVLGAAKPDYFSFVVQNAAISDAGGAITLDIQPLYFKPATGSKPLQNVSTTTIPTGSKVIFDTVTSTTYVRGLVWKRSAFLVATAKSKALAVQETGEASGFFLHMLMQRDANLLMGKDLVTWDTLMGTKALRGNGISTLLIKVA